MQMTTTFYRPLGRLGIQVSALGLGCWAIGGPFYAHEGHPLGWGKVDDQASMRAMAFGPLAPGQMREIELILGQ
jgi:aryl-alcohol dehydrogenase-like predicted oxidoreductase